MSPGTSVSGKYEEEVNNLSLIKSFKWHSFFCALVFSPGGPACLPQWMGVRGPALKQWHAWSRPLLLLVPQSFSLLS